MKDQFGWGIKRSFVEIRLNLIIEFRFSDFQINAIPIIKFC